MTAGPDDLAAVFRAEAGRCTATLIRALGDIDLAEDAIAEAFAIAAEKWPTVGVPPNPGAWITTTARNRAIDRLRREATRHTRHVAAHRLHAEGSERPAVDPLLDDLAEVVPEDQLRLMFLCCHPALSPESQVALTLRLLGGLDTEEIAKAFVVPVPTMAQRIVRAKRTLHDHGADYRIPRHAELPARVPMVLSALYLVFTQGHTATTGDTLHRPDLTLEAIRLCRVLVDLMPDEPEATGLLALMLLTEARRPARLSAAGTMVRLSEQDRHRWDTALIHEGHLLVRSCLRRGRPDRYQIQAAIAAVHTDAPSWPDTDWAQVVALYDQLLALGPDPVVELNRAVAIGELRGPAAGVEALPAVTRLERYQPFHAARADLLTRAGDTAEARTAYRRAMDLTDNPVERDFLGRRLAALESR